MADPKFTRTNAADSAPGVDDGRVRGDGPSVNSKPGGRGLAWLIVGLSLVILAIVLIARPDTTREDQTQAAIDGRAVDASREYQATPATR